MGAALTLLLLAQFVVPWNTAEAAGAVVPTDLTGQTDYVVIHKTDASGDYSSSGRGGRSSLTIRAPGGAVISPVNGVYSDVPAGATIDLNMVFHLEDGDGTNLYDYQGGESFTVTLPEGLQFNDSAGAVTAHDSTGNYDYTLATWSIAGNTLTVDLTDAAEDTTSHGGAANDDHLNKWGRIGITGTFEALSPGDGTQTRIQFGDQTVVINREPLPEQTVVLAKTHSYDASTNQITWTVTVTAPAADTDLSGYSLTDVYSANQDYVPGSFTADAGLAPTPLTPIADDSTGLNPGQADTSQLASRTVKYVFPAATAGSQTITYKTSPTTFAGETGSSSGTEYSSYSNTVSLKDGTGADAANPKTDQCTLDWISKSGQAQADLSLVKWTVSVTVPGTGAVTGAQIIDALPTGTQLVEGDTNYPIQIDFGGGGQTVTTAPDSSAGQYGYSSDTMTYSFPDAHQPAAGSTATLTYYTRVPAGEINNYLDSNGNISFTNTARMDWTENGTLTSGQLPADTAKVTGVGPGGLLSKSSGGADGETYSHVSGGGAIQWTITINRNQLSMSSASVSDSVPAGQVLLIDGTHPFSVSPDAGGTLTGGNGDSAFTYAFPGAVTGTYTITYYTQIVDTAPGTVGDSSGLDTLYANGTVEFRNDATLNYTSSGSKSVSVQGKKSYDSQMIQKTAVEQAGGYVYNYDDHTVQWQIVVNRNRLPLTGAVVEDALPAGMTLLIDGSHPFSVTNDTSSTPVGTLTSGATGDASFVYTLPAARNSDRYTITFWTRLTDEMLKTQWSGNRGFQNNGTLKADELPTAGLSSGATVQIKNPVVSKTYSRAGGSYTVDWTVAINPGQVPLTGGMVTDQMIPGLQLVESSVQLFEATVGEALVSGAVSVTATGGALTEAASAGAAEYSKTVTVDPATHANTLTVHLPTPTGKAYVLKFTTNILQGSLTLTNTVSLSGTGSGSDNTATATQITINDLYSGGGSGSRTLTVHKTDTASSPLSGAVFRLLNTYEQPVQRSGADVTKTTAASGDAVFTALPSWTFYVQETRPAPGYLLPSNPADRISAAQDLGSGNQTASFSNALALTGVSFLKAGGGGAPLSGGSFKLEGTSTYDNQTWSQTVSPTSNTDGIVQFDNVPIGTYRIYELSAPAGHAAPDPATSLGTVAVGYNGDYTGTVVTVTIGAQSSTVPGTVRLFNLPNATSVSFTKKNANTNTAITVPASLSGGTFTLTGTDYAGNAVSKTASADAAGVVTFTGVPLGGATPYVIAETAAPDGYLLPLLPVDRDILKAAVTYNTDRTGLAVSLTNMAGSPVGDNSASNAPAAGTFSFLKQSNGGTDLDGGVFTLTGLDYAGNAMTRTAPAVAGVVTFSGVPLSKSGEHYTIKETVAPGGYYLTNEELTATVAYAAGADKTRVTAVLSDGAGNSKTFNSDGTTSGSDLLMTNTPIPAPILGTAEVLKTDKDGKTLAGAEFTLYNAGGFAIDTAVSGADGVARFENIAAGTYTVRETAAPAGYLAGSDVIALTVNSTAVQRFTLVNEKEVKPSPSPSPSPSPTPAPSSAPGVSPSPSQPGSGGTVQKQGSISILKTDSSGKTLAGAQFTLYNGEGTAVRALTSGGDGWVSFRNLPAGSYTVKETAAPEGYRMETDVLSVELAAGTNKNYGLADSRTDENGGVLGWSDKGDTAKPGGKLPQTGGAAPADLALGAGGALLLAGGALALKRRRKERNAG